MFSIFISIVVAGSVVGACAAAGVKAGTTWYGVLSFLVSFYSISFLIRRKIKALQNELQESMLAGQQRINRKIQQAQNKPGTNVKLLQRQIEADQKSIFKEALAFTSRLEPFKKWSLMMGRQIITMKLQFHYQLREFDQVDAILAKSGLFRGPLYLEPMLVAMKMARQYKKGDVKGAEKTFKRRLPWFRGNRATLLYALMSWILVKSDKPEEARQLLLKGKEATGDETLAFNWERLSNDKVKSFSNEGLGDQWYGLYLENPPMPKQQRVRMSGKGHRPF
ncbi:MAG: hypothetical protein GXY61_05665 [Lentisphaerae bacterium]|nr:hypothetical protein [Lentisphaerota bacterium]